MGKILNFIKITFSISGPFIVSFGTYSGLLVFLNLFFGHEVNGSGSVSIYMAYILFLYITGAVFEMKTFDLNVERESDEIKKEEKVATRQISIVRNFLSQAYLLLLNYVLEKDKVTFFDVFKKPSYWENFNKRHKENPIFRLNVNEVSLEVRFLKNSNGLISVRKAEDGKKYGDWFDQKLTSVDYWRTLFILAPFEFIKQLKG